MNECKIVEDLLPLYAEELVSSETAEFIREHAGRCERCRKLLDRSKEAIPMKTENIPDYKKALKRDRAHSFLTGVLIMVIAYALLAAVFVVCYTPVKTGEDPIILESPDGLHSFRAEPYSSLLGTHQGLCVRRSSPIDIIKENRDGWNRILNAYWSPDGTDLLYTVEMLDGETVMNIWFNNYEDTGSSRGIFPVISYNTQKHAFDDLTAEFTKLLAQWEGFPTGWKSITYKLERWGEDSESAYIHYETDNGYEGTVYFGFDFEGKGIWIIE